MHSRTVEPGPVPCNITPVFAVVYPLKAGAHE